MWNIINRVLLSIINISVHFRSHDCSFPYGLLRRSLSFRAAHNSPWTSEWMRADARARIILKCVFITLNRLKWNAISYTKNYYYYYLIFFISHLIPNRCIKRTGGDLYEQRAWDARECPYTRKRWNNIKNRNNDKTLFSLLFFVYAKNKKDKNQRYSKTKR